MTASNAFNCKLHVSSLQICQLQDQVTNVSAQSQHDSVSTIKELKDSYHVSTERLRISHQQAVSVLQGQVRQLQEDLDDNADVLHKAHIESERVQV